MRVIAARMLIDLHWRDMGSGPAVLLLHAAPSDEAYYAPLVERLVRSCRVLYPDLPGYGRSPAQAGRYDFELTYASLERGLLERGIESCSVAGFSLGAHHALALATRECGVRWRGVFAMGAFAALAKDHAQGLLDLAAALANGAEPGSPEMLPALTATLVGTTYLASHPDLESRMRAFVRSGVPAVIAAELRSLVHSDLRPGLVRLRCPVVLRVGSIDRSTPPAYSHEIARLVPHAEVQVVPDCGHMLLLEDEEGTVDAAAHVLR